MHVGDVIAGRFVVDYLADEGGMGVVYRGTEKSTNTPVAIKVLHARGSESSSRFAREAEVLSELAHPGIVKHIVHGQTDDGDLFMVMEWLEGMDLGRRLRQQPRITVEQTLILAAHASEALGEAHARGVVHRDVKPSNLFLVDGDVAKTKLLDFGVARVNEATITLSGVTFGTPGYMAPEQARGDRNLDARADIFALGCVLFECLTGRTAFQGEHLMAVLAKILLEDAPRVRELAPTIPRALDQLVARMLTKDPQKRPANGRQVAAELAALDTHIVPPASSIYPEASITSGEQRLLCVVLAGTPVGEQARPLSDGATLVSGPLEEPTPQTANALANTQAFPTVTRPVVITPSGALRPGGGGRLNARDALSAETQERLRQAVQVCDARIECLADGSVIATLTGGQSATDQVAQAARCAFAIQAHLPDVPIVLATGRGVLAGQLPVGEAIDRAARLMRDAERTKQSSVGSILIDEVTEGLLDVRFEVDTVDGRRLLHRERDLPGVNRTLLGKPTPLVGRDRELLTLEAIFAECLEESVARAVVITAAAGSGKSRLCYEFLGKIAQRDAAPQVWIGRGDPLSAGSPFGLIARALRRSDASDDETVEGRRRRLRTRVARNVSAEDQDRVAQFLGELVGVPFAAEDSVQLRAAREDAMLMGDQMRRAWEDFLDAECRVRPVLLVLEDVHWGDLPSVKLVDAALRHLSEQPFMVLALARPEVHDIFPNLWAERSAQEIRLGELSKRSSEKLIRHVLGDVSADTVKEMIQKSAGNAFFLEELLRAHAEGRSGEMPETVLAMVQSRLERLSAQARWVLRAASVFGQVFWSGGVQTLLGGTSGGVDLVPCIHELVEREVVARRATSRFAGDQELEFQHSLIREAAYAMLTAEDKRLGHALAGQWLEKAGETDAMVLAEHFERGGDLARAGHWFAKAAEHALEGNDFEAAINRAERGIAARADETDTEITGQLRLIQSEAHGWRGEHEKAHERADQALARLPPQSPRWYIAAGEVAMASGRLARHGPLLTLVDELCNPPADKSALRAYVVATVRAAITLLYADRRGVARLLIDQIDYVESLFTNEDPVVSAVIERVRATEAVIGGDDSKYLSHLESAATFYETAGDLRNACNARSNSGHAKLKLGQNEDAIKTLREALNSAERLGIPPVISLAKHNLGLALARTGRIDEGEAYERSAADEFGAQGDRRLEAASHLYLAVIRATIEDWPGADAEAREAMSLGANIDGLRAHAQAVLAEARLESGDALAARKLATEAMGLLKRLGAIEEGEALIRLIDARTLHALGEQRAAADSISVAKERLLARASRISDPSARESFLQNVPENAAVVRLAAEWGTVPDAG